MNTMNPNVAKWRANHHKALESIAVNNKSGLTLWRKLRRVEQSMTQASEAFCNGAMSRKDFDECIRNTRTQVAVIFGGAPFGFFVNTDPRGYALKLEAENTPEGMHRDWGNYGILAAEIN